MLEHQRFDLAWIEVDAAEDDHVVGPPPNPVQAQMGAAARAAASAQHPREVGLSASLKKAALWGRILTLICLTRPGEAS
jgi:hypothetical protein